MKIIKTTTAAERAGQHIDVDILVRALDHRIPEYANLVRARVDSSIRANETADLLEITVYNTTSGDKKRVCSERPPFNADWVGLFYKYLRGKSAGANRVLEAGIEGVIAEAVLEASKEFYVSEETLAALSEGLVGQIDANEKIQSIVLAEMKDFSKFAYRETKDMVASHGKLIMADRAHDSMVSAINHTMSASVGSLAAKMVLAALGTPAVKVLITKAVIMALSHAVVHQLLYLAVKKIGIVAIIGVIFGAAGASMVGWLALPIIAGVLTYQYVEMPNKFAKKMAPEVEQMIREKAPEINRPIVVAFKNAALEAIFKAPGAIAEKGVDQFRDWALDT